MGLGKTTANLARFRQKWEQAVASGGLDGLKRAGPSRGSDLTEVTGFGSNPGALRMFVHVPENLPASPPLVVVLHGCTQNAAGYDHGAGWSTLADRYGFVVVLPEQGSGNNPNSCFNWFLAGDTERDGGEALSIRQMVTRAVQDHGVDEAKVFVTGLSAGGAMTSAMLATYPDVFAGGAIIAGLPYGTASNVQQALESMFQGRSHSGEEWGDLVRAASPHRGPWPKVSVWHGSVDATVKPMNAGEIVKQWTDVHGLAPTPSDEGVVDGYPRRVWRNKAGEEVVEEYTLTGMAHGTPLEVGDGEESLGAAGPFLLDVGISSSYHIAKFWGLTAKPIAATATKAKAAAKPEVSAERVETRLPALQPVAARAKPRDPEPGRRKGPERPSAARGQRLDVNGIITKALRSAGLMKP